MELVKAAGKKKEPQARKSKTNHAMKKESGGWQTTTTSRTHLKGWGHGRSCVRKRRSLSANKNLHGTESQFAWKKKKNGGEGTQKANSTGRENLLKQD